MKNKLIITALVFSLFCLTHTALAQPKVLVKDPVYQFESVPDGVLVPHEFRVKNIGDAPLRILNVLPP